MKIFDYKFLLTLGLSLIVYFLYREMDILTKRVAELEKSTKDKKKIEMIELPPPPPEENNNHEMEMLEIILQKANSKKSDQQMVEEYSNDNNINIYSHDNLNTNTNDHDTLMVESIINMVKDDLENNNIAEIDIHFEQIEDTVSTNKTEEILEQPTKENENVEQTNEVVEQNNEHIEQSENDSDIVLIKENTSNKISLETLNKKKLDELQELASKYNIDINNENGKKKKKSDLAQEIFNKQ
jgi:hypothetical protein